MRDRETEERELIVREAMSWLGTPYRHRCDRKGVAADCLGMMKACFRDSGLIPEIGPYEYSPQWHLHRSEERFLAGVEVFAAETNEPLPGNVAMYQEGRCFAHCGIIVHGGNLVHASWRAREVVIAPLFETGLNFFPTGKPRARKIFDPWRKRLA